MSPIKCPVIFEDPFAVAGALDAQPVTDSLDLQLRSRESSILVSGCALCLEQSGKPYDCEHCRTVTYCCKNHCLQDQHCLPIHETFHEIFCRSIHESRMRAEKLRLVLVADVEDPFHSHVRNVAG